MSWWPSPAKKVKTDSHVPYSNPWPLNDVLTSHSPRQSLWNTITPTGVNVRPRILPSMVAHTTYATGRSATQFFRDPNFCTLLTRTMVHDAPFLMTFRGVTREAWIAVMLERTAHKTLMLAPEPEAFQGVYKCIVNEKFSSTNRQICRRFMAIISTDADDISSFRAHDIFADLYQVTTVHPALKYVCPGPTIGTYLSLRHDYDIMNAPPMHMDMFLTQPPQKVIVFTNEDLKIESEDGVRLRDLFAAVLRRSRMNPWSNGICRPCPVTMRTLAMQMQWVQHRAIPKGAIQTRWALENTAKLARGDNDSEFRPFNRFTC